MSFSARGFHDHPMGYHDQDMGHHLPPMGYHEQQMEHARFDTRLTTIEENKHEIQNTLHQHSQWQEEAGQRLAAIQQHQE